MGGRLSKPVMVFVAIGLSIITLYRLQFGVDLADEAYYAAIPVQWTLGAVPFRDELSLHQTSALFVYPAVKLFHSVTGNFDGLMLFLRGYFVLLSALAALALFFLLRKRLAAPTAGFVALVPILFFPFNIPAASYNTLGYLFLTLGLFLHWTAANEKSSRLSLLAGALLGAATVVYPTLAVCAAAAFLLTPHSEWRDRVRAPLGFLIVTGGFALFVLLLTDGSYLRDAYLYTVLWGQKGGGVDKLLHLFGKVKELLFSRPYFLLWAGGAVYYGRRPVSRLGDVLLFSIPWIALLGTGPLWTPSSLFFVTALGLFFPLLAWLEKTERKEAMIAARCVWLPSAIAGLVTAYTSASGFFCAGIGLFPAALLTLVFAARAGTALSAAAILCALQFGGGVYFDDAFAKLTHRVEAGAYWGLRTTPQKAEFLRRLETDIRSVARPTDRVGYFSDFAGGVLVYPTLSPFGAADVWGGKPAVEKLYVDYFNSRNLPSVIVQMKEVPYLLVSSAAGQRSYTGDSPMAQLLKERFVLKLSNALYSVYQSVP